MSQDFGPYQFLKRLATGGMAEVWLARQQGIEGFNKHVVVKRILPHLAEDPEFVQMFLNEAKMVARFNHPNIGQIFDLGEQGGQYYIAMEYIHGEDLGRVMRRAWNSNNWVPRSVALRIVSDACQGLHYAHSRTDEQGRPLRVVHRDISPQNILVSFEGSVKLVDFGIAKAADQHSQTKSGAIKGKFAYMAPEQAMGEALSARTDIFALGLVLYELLTGVRPLKRDVELATLQAAMECKIEPPSKVADVPQGLDEVVMRALKKDPNERYQDAREFQLAIEAQLLSEGVIATSVQVSMLMEKLFADRLAEEARTGLLVPATASSQSNPATSAASSVTAKSKPGAKATAATASGQGDPDQTLFDEDAEEKATPAPPRRPSRLVVEAQGTASIAPPPRRATRTDAEYGDDEGADRPKGRSSKPQVRRATGSQPIRRPSSSTPRQPTPVESPASGGVSEPSDLEQVRRRQTVRIAFVTALVMGLGALFIAVVFKDALRELIASRSSSGAVPVRLTVTSNPPTQVFVEPPAGSKGRERLDLGWTPFSNLSGAYVDDTVVLVNLDKGIRYEQLVEAQKPNEILLIAKEFKQATLKVRITPELKGADVVIYRQGVRQGRVGEAMKLYEGIQKLELRSTALSQVVEFEVALSPGQVRELVVDVSAAAAR